MFGLGLFRTGSLSLCRPKHPGIHHSPVSVSQVQSVYSRVTTTPDQEFGFIDKKKREEETIKGKWVVQSYFIGLFLPAQVGWSPLTAVHLSFCWETSPIRIPFDHVAPCILCAALICWAIMQKLTSYIYVILFPLDSFYRILQE